MIPVAEAQALCLRGLTPLATETIPLRNAAGRMLAAPVTAHRQQPPFAASAMDGYAIDAATLAPGATFTVIGEAAAGHGWSGEIAQGQALRIFTGAPVPTGANHVVIQEDVRRDGDCITVLNSLGDGPNIRPAGADFGADFTLEAPRRLSPADLALLAAMNADKVVVTRKPSVALIATGDELVIPGGAPRGDQIIASNIFGLKAMAEAAGATVRILPIAADNDPALALAFELAAGADIIVSIGGASVGDHDLVSNAAQKHGITLDFHKIAMRPGKPLMLGHNGAAPFLGLPGNPVSAMVCGHLFLLPMVRAMLGDQTPLPAITRAQLTGALGPNGPRAHYMRAHTDGDQVTPFDRQDSALLSVLTQANCLAIRPPHDPARKAGDRIDIIAI